MINSTSPPAINAITIAAQPKPLEKLLQHILYVPTIAKNPVNACNAQDVAIPMMSAVLLLKPANLANSALPPESPKR